MRAAVHVCCIALLLAVGTIAKDCTEANVSGDRIDLDGLNGCITLNLKGSSIGPAGARALSEALKANGKVLTTLNLYGNAIGDEGAISLAEALKADGVVLVSLNLYGNMIGPSGATALAEALKSNGALATLGLGSNSIGPDGAAALADVLKTNSVLSTLGLGSNSIGDEGAQALAAALKVNDALKAFDAGSNSIGDQGALALAQALNVNGEITDIFLHNNPIGTDAMSRLQSVLGGSLMQRRQNKQEYAELLRWAAAHGLGDAELSILGAWGVTSATAARSLRGTPFDTLFPKGKGVFATLAHYFATWGAGAQVRARLFEAINTVKAEKDEL